jgi:hypothetical protein
MIPVFPRSGDRQTASGSPTIGPRPWPESRYIYWVPDRRGYGLWTRYDFPALSLMIRGVLSPGSETLVDRC